MLEKRFAFDLELLVVARRMGYQHFLELPVEIGERFTTTVSSKAVWRTLLDTLAICYRLRIAHFYRPRLGLTAPPRAARAPAVAHEAGPPAVQVPRQAATACRA